MPMPMSMSLTLIAQKRLENKNSVLIFNYNFRIDSSDDNKISKEEFTSDSIKASLEKWVGPIEDWDAEFDKVELLVLKFQNAFFTYNAIQFII
jgi:hypothetical protein